MELDFKKIARAWYDSYLGSDAQKELAKARAAICEQCPARVKGFRNLAPYPKCSLCGCPIGKKVFSGVFNDCPDKKWKEVDQASTIFKRGNSII